MDEQETPADQQAQRPDRLVLGLRFGCGGVVGLLMALPLLLRVTEPWHVPAVLIGGFVVAGTLVARYGDELLGTLIRSWW